MPRPLTRRQFLRRSTAAAAATWGSSLWLPGVAQARARTLAVSATPEGTTLVSTFAPDGEGLYLRLTEAPAWPTIVRELNATAGSARSDNRRALASVIHLTDVHVVDAQSPARVEFLDRQADPPQEDVPFSSAWRAQETLAMQVSDAMNQQLRTVGGGPITGRGYDCCVSTGDNTDNMQVNELAWFLQLLDGGGQLAPNSGAEDRYEGVQDDVDEVVSGVEGVSGPVSTYDTHYWHPNPIDPSQQDRYKTEFDFPTMPGFLDAAIAPFSPVGIGVPWYSVYGNHDGLLQGNAPTNDVFDGIATGEWKFLVGGGSTGTFADLAEQGDPTAAGGVFTGPAREVTPAGDRVTAKITDWVQAHLDSPATPGPVGHGYREEAKESLELYYTFEIAEGVLGISLDTVNRGGYADGSIGDAQLAWLEQQLIDHSSSYVDSSGAEVSAGNDDHLIVLFSHHNLSTLGNPNPDPTMPDDQRNMEDAVLEVLHRFENVVAWVNGHSHVNRVTPYPDRAGNTSGFWEVSTAAHIDFPQQSRILELVDNGDDTLSIFGTLVDHAGPKTAELASDPGTTDVLSLASIARELAFNDPQHGPDYGLGRIKEDRNVELLLPAPFVLSSIGASTDDTDTDGAPDDDDESGSLAATGGGAVGLAALAISGAVALRTRGREDDRDDGDAVDPVTR